MKTRITTLSLGLLVTAAYAAPLPSPQLRVTPNEVDSRIQAHTHRDDRTAIVVSGTWYFGYGPVAGAAAKKALPAGSFYTEPSGVAHFAETKADPVVVYITGNGPTDTVYVK